MIEPTNQRNSNISFDNITGSDEQIEALYNQLKNRKYDISHRFLPRFQDHILFVKNHPYRYWVMIMKDGLPIGTFYIQADNSVGFNIMEPSLCLVSEVLAYIRKNFTPVKEVKSKIPPYFYVNVPFKHEKLGELLVTLDAVPIQISYKV
jgi:hypothetical protein